MFIMAILCTLKFSLEALPIVALALLFIGLANKREKKRARAERINEINKSIRHMRAIH